MTPDLSVTIAEKLLQRSVDKKVQEQVIKESLDKDHATVGLGIGVGGTQASGEHGQRGIRLLLGDILLGPGQRRYG